MSLSVRHNFYPLSVKEGEDKTFQFDLSRINDLEYDLTGCVVTAEVRDVLHRLVLRMTSAIVDPGLGIVNLSVARIDTIGRSGLHYWDLRIESPLGNDYLEGGTFRIHRSVTGVAFIHLGMHLVGESTVWAELS